MRKPNIYSPQHISICLSNASNNEDFEDDTRPLSKSLVGGSMNISKIRVLTFVPAERVFQGNVVPVVPRARTRMIMSEKPNDGTVAMHYGDIADGDFLNAEDYLPTLPNTHFADLLASQFCSLMIREGYLLEDRHLQPKPTRMNITSSSQPNAPLAPPNNPALEMQQYAEAVSSQPSNEVAKSTSSGNASLNSSQNHLASTRILPPGNPQALQMSQGLMPGGSMPARPQQMDPQTPLQQQPPQQPQQQQNQHSLIQQQHPQFQRSPLMLATNPLSHMNTIGQNSTMQLGNHMVNKPSTLQLQPLQQQQLQQQRPQPQIQRKMMMGLGTAVNMGNMGNNMVGLGGLGNVMGMEGARGIGGSGISAPMGPISGMGNVGQNPMNLSQASTTSNTISQQLRSGQLTPEQAALVASKLKMVQNRASILGNPQSPITGMSGARQLHLGSGLSMLGQTLNRANINPMQRTAMGPMDPPKLMTEMTGMNLYMNQQLQLQQQHMQQQQRLQQQQPQQQETASPLQAVVSPPQVGSPSTMGIPQQLIQQLQQQQQQTSPQQMNQRTPMSPQQMSSGAVHPMSAGNPEGCPASPQLSSQTLGSVCSIANSPLELQVVNKSNSVSNA